MQTPTFTRIANIDALHTRATGPSKGAVVVLHGYGANMQDLAPLAPYIDPSHRYDWYFLNGIESLSFPGAYEGRAWFPLSVDRLIHRAQVGRFEEIADEPLPAMDKPALAVRDFIKALPHENLILAGFSQGSMTALHTWLSTDITPSALLLWSSSIVNRPIWQKLIQLKSKRPKALVTHGRYDPVLPYALSQTLHKFLREHDVPTTFLDFDGGHELPPEVIAASAKMIF